MFKQGTQDVNLALSAQKRSLMQCRADLEATAAEASARFMTLENLFKTLEVRISEGLSRQSAGFERLTLRDEETSHVIEQVRLQLRTFHSEGGRDSARIEDIETALSAHQDDVQSMISRERQARDDLIQASQKSTLALQSQAFSNIETRLHERLEEESQRRQATVAQVMDDVGSAIEKVNTQTAPSERSLLQHDSVPMPVASAAPPIERSEVRTPRGPVISVPCSQGQTPLLQFMQPGNQPLMGQTPLSARGVGQSVVQPPGAFPQLVGMTRSSPSPGAVLTVLNRSASSPSAGRVGAIPRRLPQQMQGTSLQPAAFAPGSPSIPPGSVLVVGKPGMLTDRRNGEERHRESFHPIEMQMVNGALSPRTPPPKAPIGQMRR